ncbi:sensor histidine kinase [Sphaerisporangium album]|uniref:Signal transduction histidine-protein kinase/phosphatase MprB n=1 Tax=Sphaerisporangium album TaxID=509200 RepID=A0A367FLI7_9ACTN|nr:HAMP domain-containing sensor histidine kinase [Sphaerisporangium album]RCG31134.1 sensor histidine kinase [Sphaerisporangium album]
MSAEGTPLRHRALAAIVAVTALAVLLFAAPLAASVDQLYHDETAVGLQRDAAWIAAAVPDDVGRDPRVPLALPRNIAADLTVGVYTVKGARRLFGAGPDISALAAAGRDGHTHQRIEDGYLAVTAPIPSDEGISLVVRVAVAHDLIEDRIHRAWMLMAVLGLIALGLAAGMAIYLSRRLATPLERLTGAALALGDGDFTVRAPRSGLREADQAGAALEATARRLGDVLAREQAFSADVSHQLRTGLTGLLLGLESARTRPAAGQAEAIEIALARGERLRTVIEDLVTLARDTHAGRPLDVRALMEEARRHWHGLLAERGRRLTIRIEPDLPPLTAAPAAVRQILLVLLDNALTHGAGEVVITVSDVGPGVAVNVGDQGKGVPDGQDVFARSASPEDGHGIGLPLARSLAEAEGGRLVLHRNAPPVFSLLLPASPS